MFRNWICLLAGVLPVWLLAQAPPTGENQLSLSYFGEYVTHPGIRVGGLHTWLRMDEASQSPKASNWTTGVFLTHYQHRRNHTGTLFTAQFGRKYQGRKGLLLQAGLEAGYMLSRLDGQSFAWTGDAIAETGKGRSHATWGLNGGIGLDLYPSLKLPVSAELMPHLFFQAPYNTLFLPRFAVEFRLSYRLP